MTFGVLGAVAAVGVAGGLWLNGRMGDHTDSTPLRQIERDPMARYVPPQSRKTLFRYDRDASVSPNMPAPAEAMRTYAVPIRDGSAALAATVAEAGRVGWTMDPAPTGDAKRVLDALHRKNPGTQVVSGARAAGSQALRISITVQPGSASTPVPRGDTQLTINIESAGAVPDPRGIDSGTGRAVGTPAP